MRVMEGFWCLTTSPARRQQLKLLPTCPPCSYRDLAPAAAAARLPAEGATAAQLAAFVRQCVRRYDGKRCDPGSTVGAFGAQSIGESYARPPARLRASSVPPLVLRNLPPPNHLSLSPLPAPAASLLPPPLRCPQASRARR